MTAAPGNREFTAEELPALVSGELPAVLPLDGWTTITLHGQLDAVGPSSRHHDLSEIVVSIPPAADVSERPCRRCQGLGRVPATWETPRTAPLMPCPACTPGAPPVCTATALHALYGTIHCGREAGHNDNALRALENTPSWWHRGTRGAEGAFSWCDDFDGAVPHSRAVAKPGASCPACGPTALEPHPHKTLVMRCTNCKEWLHLQ
ncbi:hypothetical protein ACIOFY_36795 [Streptomyces anulatus]